MSSHQRFAMLLSAIGCRAGAALAHANDPSLSRILELHAERLEGHARLGADWVWG